MSAYAAAPPVITPVDRLGLTLCLAVITHAVLILGITFTPDDAVQPRYDTMEIVLVQQTSREAPEDAKLLAQANLEAGGEAMEDVTPATPMTPPFPEPEANITAPPMPTLPQPAPARSEESSPATTSPDQVLAADSPDPDRKKPDKLAPEQETAEQTERPTATALLTNSFKIAALSAEIKRKLEARSSRPRRKFVSASTQEYRYAAYMEAWREKVQRIGNINYPDEARVRRLSGNLILDVALNPDGSVNQITIRRSSGYQVLDDAAVRIVHLAAPFAPFPKDIRAETDIMHITRTWQFLYNGGFQ